VKNQLLNYLNLNQKTLKELIDIKGLGAGKIQQIGADLLNCIRLFLSEPLLTQSEEDEIKKIIKEQKNLL